MEAFIRDLSSATTFEQAARLTLDGVLERAQEALRGSALASPTTLHRATLHLRPDGSYVALLAVEPGKGAPVNASGAAVHSSVTAWRYLQSLRRPVHIDVQAWTVATAEGSANIEDPPPASADTTGSGTTKRHLLGRGVTHLTALPIVDGADELVGMITVELTCVQAISAGFPLQGLESALAEPIALATPSLLSLPHSPAPAQSVDPLLPVVGPRMAEPVRMLRLFCAQDATLLIQGETGTGKSRIAEWCHANSTYRDGPFHSLSLHGLSKEMGFANTVGWKRGGFTNAVSDNPGALEQAEGGTLVLEDINLLSFDAQASLLHLLETRRYRPLGALGPDRVANVRFIVTSNESLRKLVRENRFREDLYFRLDQLTIRLPPLRERADEIPDWARHFLGEELRRRPSLAGVGFSAEALKRLRAEPWPGNLRELQTVVTRAITRMELHGGGPVIEVDHVEAAFDREQEPAPSGELLGLLEQVARLWVRHASDARDIGLDLPLELTDALDHLILERAERALGAPEEVARALGLVHVLEHRNLRRLKNDRRHHHEELVKRLSRITRS